MEGMWQTFVGKMKAELEPYGESIKEMWEADWETLRHEDKFYRALEVPFELAREFVKGVSGAVGRVFDPKNWAVGGRSIQRMHCWLQG